MNKPNSGVMNVGFPTNSPLPLEVSNAINTVIKQPLSFASMPNLQQQTLTMLELRSRFPVLTDSFLSVPAHQEADIRALTDVELRELAVALRVILAAAISEEEIISAAAATPSPDFVSELNDINFSKLISGPLQGAIDSQISSSIASANFIKEVGFDEEGNVRYVDFKIKEKTGELNADGTEKELDKTIKVPLLSMVTVPSLRIETVDIDFNCKLNSVQTENTTTKIGADASVSGKFPRVKFKVSASYRRSKSSGIKIEKEYTMAVKVKATQDEMPAGLEKILNLLSN